METSPLGRYLRRKGLTQTEFAEITGVPQCQISAYLRGVAKPGRKSANAIERATKGAVPATSWDDAPTRKAG